jgi:hypothetical protein
LNWSASRPTRQNCTSRLPKVWEGTPSCRPELQRLFVRVSRSQPKQTQL